MPTGLLRRFDVEAVYAQISEIDPGEGAWPFTDTVFTVGPFRWRSCVTCWLPLSRTKLPPVSFPQGIRQQHRAPAMVVWWD